MQNLENIPLEMRKYAQWVIWRTIVRDGRPTKPLYQPQQPNELASVSNPATWGTFEQAKAAYEANPDHIKGIGFVFTDKDPFFGIDIDDESEVASENLDVRKLVVNKILSEVITYSEISPSGNGLHLIGKGKLPSKGRRSPALKIELYGESRYFTMTGAIFQNRAEITEQQPFVDEFYSQFDIDSDGDSPEDITAYRRNDLTDEEVIQLASNYHPYFAPRFNGQLDCNPGEWSETFMAIIGILDRFTGSVDQIKRIVMHSGMVTLAPNAANNETRAAKANRNFNRVLGQVRAGNNRQMHFIEHGRAIVAALNETARKRAQEAAEAVAKAGEILDQDKHKIGEAFKPVLGENWEELSYPPGVLGEYVRATENAMRNPFLKFAIPSTIASLAGVVSRGYKLSDGIGLNLNFILAAPSATGKSQTMGIWNRFIRDCAGMIENNLAGPSRSRIVNQGALSIQGIFEDFMNTPSCCWMVDECAAQLRVMSNPKTGTEMQLRDSYNMLYDASEHGRFFSPPRSIASKKAEIKAINNLSVSTYWTTTDSKFDVFGTDALDGFLSRITVVRHTGTAGTLRMSDEIQPDLPEHLRQNLVVLLDKAKKLDEAYQYNVSEAATMLAIVSHDGVRLLHNSLSRLCDMIKNSALSDELPREYVSYARLPLTAIRIAAIMAILENPYAPAITNDQMVWAFSYVLQNIKSLMFDLDSGQIGQLANDEVMAVVRAMRFLLLQRKKQPKRYHGEPIGVPRSELRDFVKRRKPFSESRGDFKGPSKRVTETLEYMMKEGMIEEVNETHLPGRGRRAKLVCPTNDSVWDV